MSRRIYREFYLLPRGEQRALILLSLLLILSLIFRIMVQFLPEKEPEGMEEFEQEARRIIASIARADSLDRSGSNRTRQYPASSFQTKTIPVAYPIDINRADSAQLLPLPGIGPVFAGRIIKYRNLLGGYVSVDQLGEVYGISAETLDMIRGRITIDTSLICKMPLNHATFRELLRHPYLEYENVKAIVNYRDFKDTIRSFRELYENSILPDSLLHRVLPYLDLQ